MVVLSIWKVVSCQYLCYLDGWQPSHYGRQFVVEIFLTTMDGSLVIMEGSILSTSLLLQWMVTQLLWKVVCVEIFVTTMDGSLIIMDGSLLLISLLLQWMVAQSLWKVVCCRYFCYSKGWWPCHQGRQSIVEIFNYTVVPIKEQWNSVRRP